MKKSFACMLCARAGRKTLAPKARRGSLICEDCDEVLRHSERFWCNKCRRVVPLAEWCEKQAQCRPCRNAHARAWRAAHPEYRARQIEQMRAWRAERPHYASHAGRAWRKRNPDYWKASLARNRLWKRMKFATDPAFRERALANSRAYWPWRKRKREVLGR